MKPHDEDKQTAAILLYDEWENYDRVARCLGISRQTVRRWIVPGERERHNLYINSHRPALETTRRGKPLNDHDHQQRIMAHKARVQQTPIEAHV